MFKWLPFAFLRITACFAVGIVLGAFNPEFTSEAIGIGLISLLALFTLVKFTSSKSFFLRSAIFGSLGLLGCMAAGYLVAVDRQEIYHEDHIENFEFSHYKAVIVSSPEIKTNSTRMELKIMAVLADTVWAPALGRVQFDVHNTDSIRFQYGDELIIKGSPQELEGPANPYEFNYKQYLRFNNIYHRQYAESNQLVVIGNNPEWGLVARALEAREFFSQILSSHIDSKRELNIIMALTLGVKEGLDPETKRAYSAAGAMHVLAVSGLHVGIIYVLVLFLLKPLGKRWYHRWLRAIISMMFLWTFAFITGLSPSVLRAVTMFSFVAVGQALGRNSSTMNTLAVSAFVLLWIDPFLLMSVGFQLSYLAVFGIVYLHPKLYSIWAPSSWIADKLWSISCVAVAAQIATAPLGLLYFHQFPTYFFLSNLIVIPAAFLVLILTIIVLATSPLPFIAGLVAKLLFGVVWILNEIVVFVEHLPYSQIDEVSITTMDTWLIYLFIGALLLLFHYRNIKFAGLAVAILAMLSFNQLQQIMDNSNQLSIVIYDINRHAAVDFVSGHDVHTLMDSTLQIDQNRLRFHVAPFRLNAGLSNPFEKDYPPVYREVGESKLVVWKGLTLFFLTKSTDLSLVDMVNPDYLIIQNNAVRDLEELAQFRATKVVADRTNSYYVSKYLKEQSNELAVDFHSMALDHSLRINLR